MMFYILNILYDNLFSFDCLEKSRYHFYFDCARRIKEENKNN